MFSLLFPDPRLDTWWKSKVQVYLERTPWFPPDATPLGEENRQADGGMGERPGLGGVRWARWACRGRDVQHLGQLPAARSREASSSGCGAFTSTMHCSAGGYRGGGRRRPNPAQFIPHSCASSAYTAAWGAKHFYRFHGRRKDGRGREKKVIARLPGRGTANCF